MLRRSKTGNPTVLCMGKGKPPKRTSPRSSTPGPEISCRVTQNFGADLHEAKKVNRRDESENLPPMKLVTTLHMNSSFEPKGWIHLRSGALVVVGGALNLPKCPAKTQQTRTVPCAR